VWFSRPDCRYRHRTLAAWRRIARLGVIESPRADSNRRLAYYRRFRIDKALLALSCPGPDRLRHLVCQLFGQRDCLAQRTLPAVHRREDGTAAERKCTVRNAAMFILDRVTGSDRSVTDYVLERAAKRECMSVIHTLQRQTLDATFVSSQRFFQYATVDQLSASFCDQRDGQRSGRWLHPRCQQANFRASGCSVRRWSQK